MAQQLCRAVCGGHQTHTGIGVREDSDYACPSFDLFVEPLQYARCSDLAVIGLRKRIKCQRVLQALLQCFDHFGIARGVLLTQRGRSLSCSRRGGSKPNFLDLDSLAKESRDMSEDISHEMGLAALPACPGKTLANGCSQTTGRI